MLPLLGSLGACARVDLHDYPTIQRWRRGPTTVSTRLMGDSAVRREHVARTIQCGDEAGNQLYIDEDLAILRTDLDVIDEEWETARGPDANRGNPHF